MEPERRASKVSGEVPGRGDEEEGPLGRAYNLSQWEDWD